MKKTILAAVLLAGTALTSMPANAEFILADNVFADLGATGFGNFPRLLTLQNSPNESGAVVSNFGVEGFLSPITVSGTFDVVGVPCTSNQTCSGGGLQVNQSNLTNIATMGWTSGAQVGVGLDTNQTGSTTGLLFNELVLNIFNASGAIVGTFGGNDAVLITLAQLAAQQGNGNSVFNLGLTVPEQAEFDLMLANNPGPLFAGLAAAFGCTPTPPLTSCIGQSFDGAESFLGFPQSAAVPIPGPIAGAGLPGLVAACAGLFALARRRRQKIA
jgi:hypothetical protein